MKEKVKPEIKSIGTFQISSGAVRVSDPCYEIDTWCAGTLTNVKNGTWNCKIKYSDEGNWGKRIAQLIAEHENFKPHGSKKEKIPFTIGVDSGQAGIFDSSIYRNDEAIKEDYDELHWERYPEDENGDKFYSTCCARTVGDEEDETSVYTAAGLLKMGCVSSSGFGDGSYSGFIYRNKNSEVVKITIIFIK